MVISWLKIGIKKSSILALLLFSTVTWSQCIEVSWTEAPTEREDETPIQAIEKYYLSHTFENVLLPIIEIDRAATTYDVCEPQVGVHLFELVVIELNDAGGEVPSKPSNTASQLIHPEVIPTQSPPNEVLITVRVIVSVDDRTTVQTVD